MLKVTKVIRTRNVSSAIGTPMDGHLTEEQNDKLYEKWNDEWGTKFEYRGGLVGITAEMVVVVPEDQLKKAYGKKLADVLIVIAKDQASTY